MMRFIYLMKVEKHAHYHVKYWFLLNILIKNAVVINCFYRVCKCDVISWELDWIEMNWFDISNADD